MPGVLTTPYDTAEDVMNRARVFANDAGLSLAGDLLADSQPYVPELLNAAYESLQDDMTLNGVETMGKEVILTPIQPVVTPDPGVQVSLGYNGFNNGTTNYNVPALPADMLGPLKLMERPTGTVGQFIPMVERIDGLPSLTQSSFLRWWQWLNDQIVMIGALQQNDIKLRYNVILPKLVLTPQPSQVLILRGKNALAWKIVEIFAAGRDGEEGAAFAGGKYQEELTKLLGRTAKRKQRAVSRRQPWGGRRRRFWR